MKRACLVALLGLLPGLAGAQEAAELNAEFFKPAPGYSILGVREGRLVPHLKFAFDAFINFAQNPVIAADQNTGEVLSEVIAVQTALDVMGAVGIKNYLEFGFALPLALIQNGDALDGINGNAAVSGSSLGDLRLSAKLRFIGDPSQKEGFFLAFTPEISLPTGNGPELFGAAGTSSLLALSASWRFSRAAISLNAGPRLQKQVDILNLEVGKFIEAGAGGSYAINEKLSLLGEVNGAVSLDSLGVGQSPAEARAGAKIRLAKNLWLPIAAGVGLTNGIGAPDFRVILGLNISPDDSDSDQDGILGSSDKCPKDPEDKDNFEDSDGCPEDNDKDGIADAQDSCPMEAGPQELQGCPDKDGDTIVDKNDACVDVPGLKEFDGCPDTDKDGIADAKDSCPAEAGPQELQGCPDKDGDKIADKSDACPDVAGLVDFQGCPDTDGDKLADNKDKCPKDPEDFDKFEDEDGCPDNDNDQDKIVDANDKCPTEKEDGKGKTPDDGCPDSTKATIVGGKIFILDKVYFNTGKDTLQKKSFPVLDAVVKVLNDHPEITKIEVQGHTDDQGNDDSNQDLSDRRAKRVLDYLVSKGIDASRVASKGFGESTPLVPIIGLEKQKNELKAARDQNRRVEFTILEQKQ